MDGKNVLNEEIKEAIFSLLTDKALGPDGFTMPSIKNVGTIKDDLLRVYTEFYSIQNNKRN